MTSNSDENGRRGGRSSAIDGAKLNATTTPIRRFYVTPSVGDGPPFPVLLDARAVKTPAKNLLRVPTFALASAIAEEWAAQGDTVNPASMPLTRLANTAIDGVTPSAGAVAADIAAYAGSDLLCYRAEGPIELVAAQSKLWNPVIAWARDAIGAKFEIAVGVMPIEQPPAAIAAIARSLQPHDAFRLAALHVLTTLTGSALLAVAVDRKSISPAGAWTAAHVDEDYQISLWGEDFDAAARRRARRVEFDAACQMLTLRE